MRIIFENKINYQSFSSIILSMLISFSSLTLFGGNGETRGGSGLAVPFNDPMKPGVLIDLIQDPRYHNLPLVIEPEMKALYLEITNSITYKLIGYTPITPKSFPIWNSLDIKLMRIKKSSPEFYHWIEEAKSGLPTWYFIDESLNNERDQLSKKWVLSNDTSSKYFIVPFISYKTDHIPRIVTSEFQKINKLNFEASIVHELLRHIQLTFGFNDFSDINLQKLTAEIILGSENSPIVIENYLNGTLRENILKARDFESKRSQVLNLICSFLNSDSNQSEFKMIFKTSLEFGHSICNKAAKPDEINDLISKMHEDLLPILNDSEFKKFNSSQLIPAKENKKNDSNKKPKESNVENNKKSRFLLKEFEQKASQKTRLFLKLSENKDFRISLTKLLSLLNEVGDYSPMKDLLKNFTDQSKSIQNIMLIFDLERIFSLTAFIIEPLLNQSLIQEGTQNNTLIAILDRTIKKQWPKNEIKDIEKSFCKILNEVRSDLDLSLFDERSCQVRIEIAQSLWLKSNLTHRENIKNIFQLYDEYLVLVDTLSSTEFNEALVSNLKNEDGILNTYNTIIENRGKDMTSEIKEIFLFSKLLKENLDRRITDYLSKNPKLTSKSIETQNVDKLWENKFHDSKLIQWIEDSDLFFSRLNRYNLLFKYNRDPSLSEKMD